MQIYHPQHQHDRIGTVIGKSIQTKTSSASVFTMTTTTIILLWRFLRQDFTFQLLRNYCTTKYMPNGEPRGRARCDRQMNHPPKWFIWPMEICGKYLINSMFIVKLSIMQNRSSMRWATIRIAAWTANDDRWTVRALLFKWWRKVNGNYKVIERKNKR